MFAAVTLAGLVESVTALVTASVDTHTDWSVDTKDMAVHLVPGVRVHVEAKAFCKLLGSLAVDLCARNAFSFKDSLSIIELWKSAFWHLSGFAAWGQSYCLFRNDNL